MKRRRRRRSKSSILSTRVDGVLRRVIDYPSALLEAEAEASYVAGFPEGVDVTVLGLVGGAPGGETPRVADSSAAGAGRSQGSPCSHLVCYQLACMSELQQSAPRAPRRTG
jgi:hypothetical protein